MAAPRQAHDYELPWLILNLGGELFALEIVHVREMVQMVDLNPVPHAPDYIRGVTNRRNRSLTVLDLRKRLGMQSAGQQTEALVRLLQEREQDHVAWLEELEACVHDVREFKLARDPAKCAFGEWYRSYHTDNLTLRAHLKRFERPHRQIHAVADQAMALVAEGKQKQALALISDTRITTLDVMRRLFQGGVTLLRESVTETLVIMEHDDQLLGLTTDIVDSVEHLEPGSIQDIVLPGGSWNLDEQPVRCTAKTARSNRLVMVLDASALTATLHAAQTV